MKCIFYVLIFIVIGTLITGCSKSNSNSDVEGNYRTYMRSFVQSISTYSKAIKSDFVVIPQNGHDLLTDDGKSTGTLVQAYINSIDGVGREDLFYGYNNDNEATLEADKNNMITFMDLAKNNGKKVLVIDYCSTQTYVDDSYSQNASKGYISFGADKRELSSIPAYPSTPYNVNSSNVTSLLDAKNFLYLINTGSYSSKSAFISAIQNTNYDILIIDLFYNGTEQLTSSDVTALKVKANGGTRLVFAYMSIGEAEDYRYYWQSSWKTNPPSWLAAENPEWAGNYKVRYWDSSWQSIIYGNDSSYLKKILDTGFDGVYLDIIDAFEYFENQ